MSEVSERIEHRIAALIGAELIVEEDGDRLVVSGPVETPEARADAIGIARAESGGRQVEDGIEVATVLPGEIEGVDLAEGDIGDFRGGDPGYIEEHEALEPGDFADQDTLNYPQHASGPSDMLDDVVSEGGGVYTPPTDPVGNNREVIGGLQHSSMDSIEVDRSASDNIPGDEALKDAILRELREDAATTGLEIEVLVRRGVARLRGRVPFLEDAENAEEVAARVPGLIEVLDETEVSEFTD